MIHFCRNRSLGNNDKWLLTDKLMKDDKLYQLEYDPFFILWEFKIGTCTILTMTDKWFIFSFSLDLSLTKFNS